MKLEPIREAYETCAGQWSGCDWPTRFGPLGLDLNGWTSAVAAGMAAETTDPLRAAEWEAASVWLGQVEQLAEQAAVQAALALAAANACEFTQARNHARRAWDLEKESGRPDFVGPDVPTWRHLCEAVQACAGTPPSPAQEVGVVAELRQEIRLLTEFVERLERRLDLMEAQVGGVQRFPFQFGAR